MTDRLSFEIVTPAGLKFQTEVYQVQVPTPQGYIGILAHHANLVTIVTPGVIIIHRHAEDTSEQIEHLATAGGFLEVDSHRARLLADTAERAEDVDELEAKRALRRAMALRQKARDVVSFADAVSLIERQTARLKVAEIHRRRHSRLSLIEEAE